ncbi:MAG: PHA/PHB synthase family protein [Egibacteraceae bacterium]
MSASEFAESTAESAALSLAPESGLLADLDPALWGETLLKVAAGVARHPTALARLSTRYATDVTRSLFAAWARTMGAKITGPVPTGNDRRFKDPAWEQNFLFFAMRQQYLALSRLLDDLVNAAALEPAVKGRADLVMGLVSDAIAPTNFLLTNPDALKKAFETGGISVVRGMRNFIDDLANNQGRPRQVDTSSFQLGENLAATPGRVVFRNDLMELIQYEPQTDRVGSIPILCSPPWINKYYVMDLAPGRSLIEWAVQHGHTVFMISYRNPDASMSETTMDDYLIHGPCAALDVVKSITKSDKVNMVGLCLGGALTAILAAYLKKVGDDSINSITLQNTLLDYSEPGPLGCFTDPEIVRRLEIKMERRGYLDAKEMSATFDILRANDLIFNYVVSSWLKGEGPPAFDILAWNSDSTRMPATMHSFYLRQFYLRNGLAKGELKICGQTIDLSDIEADTFIVAAENDHIAPWRSSHKSTQLLGGTVRFVLTNAGHIAGIVNPPSPKARHWTGLDTEPDPVKWREQATRIDETWWETWATWIGEHSGDQRKPPPMGNKSYPAGDPAPGAYVRG